MGLFDVTSASLEVALRGVEQRQSAISNNIANVNTPGFKRSDVSFEQALSRAIGSNGANEASILTVQPATATDSASSMRADGNNVDVDRENANLAATQIMFETLSAIETKRMKGLSSLISGAH